VVRTVRGYELAGVKVVLVPSLLASVERTRVGVALALEIIDGIDSVCGVTITDSDHDSVLIRTHYSGDVVQH